MTFICFVQIWSDQTLETCMDLLLRIYLDQIQRNIQFMEQFKKDHKFLHGELNNQTIN